MDFGYTPQQQALRNSITTFVKENVNPVLRYPPDPAQFDRELWMVCAKEGLLSLNMPTPWVIGSETDLLTMVIALECFGYSCDDNGLPFALATQGCTVQQTIVQHGSDEQKAHYLPGAIRGELIGSHAMTEPDAGSDSGKIGLVATRVDGGYALTGEKIMIGLAPVADFCVVFATVNPEAGRWGITAFLLDTNSPGFHVSTPTTKMGLDSVPMGSITLSSCIVPEGNRIGPEGSGAAIAHHALELERTCILASQVGRMQRQLDISVAHAKSRQQFGQPVGNFQAVSHRIAEMHLRVETARLLLYKTAWSIDQGQSATLDSSVLKLHISESFLASSIDSMRVHGGYSYIEDHATGRDTRDALGGVLYAGTSDIQRNIIAGMLGL